MRQDLAIIADLVTRGARVLDLGCGGGELLSHLKQFKGVNGYGLEIDPDMITGCIKAGVNVIEQDLDRGLTNFPTGSFDLVVMTDTLQSVRHPDLMLEEMLRIGRECIVTFPNFAHWRCRAYLATRGRMPVARHLPHRWYDTPNIHLMTIRDFRTFLQGLDIKIHEEVYTMSHAGEVPPLAEWWPNMCAPTAVFLVSR